MSNLIFAIGNRDLARVVWTPRGVGAMLYLVVGGSWIGYTSYIWLLRHAPSSKVSTYAYVNPVVAVFLGWLVLHEAIDRYILMGSAIIIASVIMVTSAKIFRQAGSGRNAGGRGGGRLVRVSDSGFVKKSCHPERTEGPMHFCGCASRTSVKQESA